LCNGRSLFERPKPVSERWSSSIPTGRFSVIATIAGGDSRTELQVSVTVRQQLEDSGFTIVRRAGRWDSELAALRAICAPDAVPVVDGVLFIWYNRLELRDCATEGTAYEIAGSPEGGVGVIEMSDRLVRYLKRPAAPTPQRAP
jgi:hypothetical protein